jgi:hypothetical protein
MRHGGRGEAEAGRVSQRGQVRQMGEMVRPEWATKPIGQLTAQEIAAALDFLVDLNAGDDVFRRALARQLLIVS